MIGDISVRADQVVIVHAKVGYRSIYRVLRVLVLIPISKIIPNKSSVMCKKTKKTREENKNKGVKEVKKPGGEGMLGHSIPLEFAIQDKGYISMQSYLNRQKS